MSPEVRKRYDDALERLRGVVSGTGNARDRIDALLRRTASRIEAALQRDPDADIDAIVEEFRAAVEAIVMENMRAAARAAYEDEDDDSGAEVALAVTFARTDIDTPVRRYSEALSQEVAWFIAGGFAYSALRSFLKDPLGFITAESTKPMNKKGDADYPRSGATLGGRPSRRQADGRMLLAPVFMDGTRRRSLSEVLADLRKSVPAVNTGNSYQVGRSAWTLLNATSMRAYEDALGILWAGKQVIGYYVYRASSYDCPLCDDECGRLHPLTEMVVPIHPNCVCVTVEAYEGETPEDFSNPG